MLNKTIIIFVLMNIFISSYAYSNEWIRDTTVVQVGTYQYSQVHYVWLSSGHSSECIAENPINPTLYFNEGNVGGKSLMSVLTTAVISKAKVDVQVSGCDIVEVYLK
ncbi:hypothetical protein ACPV54_10715 [Vibrio mediterranei]